MIDILAKTIKEGKIFQQNINPMRVGLILIKLLENLNCPNHIFDSLKSEIEDNLL